MVSAMEALWALGAPEPKKRLKRPDARVGMWWNGCEGLSGVYSTIWCLCYKTNELKKKKQKEKHWACLHRLKKKGVAFVAAEHGSVEPSRSTRHDVTCSNRRPGLRLRARALCLTGKISRGSDIT